MKYDHLIGREFDYKTQNCYHLVRAFYADNFEIHLPNYACPKDFWAHGLDLYWDMYRKNGFEVLDCHPSEYRVGDVFLMAIKSEVANHIGVLVDQNQMLHHLWGNLSTVDSYRALLRNTTVGVFRHRDVKITTTETAVNLLDLVSPSVRRKLDDHLAASQSV